MVDGRALGFEVLGLKDGVFLMFDRETDSVWTHFEGKALEGRLAGTQMPLIPLQQMEWGEWKERRPDTLVLAEQTGFESRYRAIRPGFATGFTGAFVDQRLPPNAIVIGVRAGEQDRAYPVDLVAASSGMVNDELAGMPIVVTYDAAAAGGLAYSRSVDGEVLTFEPSDQAGGTMRDVQTGSIWSSSGAAIDGPMSGRSLEWIPSFITQWYGWSIYHPESTIVGTPEEWARVDAPETRGSGR